MIDGTKRATAEDLLKHPYFDEEFLANFSKNFTEQLADDKTLTEELAAVIHKTKDGREELRPEELASDEEEEEEDE